MIVTPQFQTAVRESKLTLQNHKLTLSPHRGALFRNIITFR
jgi:hypothetical protein